MHTPLPSQMLCLPIPPWYFLLVVKYYIPLKCLSGHLSRLASGFCSCVFPTSPSTTWPRSPAPAVEMTAPALLQRERGGVAPLRERKHCQMKIQGGPAFPGRPGRESEGLRCICCYCTYACAPGCADTQTGQGSSAFPTVCTLPAQHHGWIQTDPPCRRLPPPRGHEPGHSAGSSLRASALQGDPLRGIYC